MKNLIRHIKNYVPLNDYEVNRIKEEIRVISIQKKEFLFEEGNIFQSNYFVNYGCLRMYFIKDNGAEQITDFAIENWWISDYMSLLTQKASAFNIQAIEDSEIIELKASSNEQLIEDVPQLERYFRLLAQRANAAAQYRIKFLYSFSREELYHHFSSHFPEFVQRIPQYMLASYLGFTPEYLSEIRKKRDSIS